MRVSRLGTFPPSGVSPSMSSPRKTSRPKKQHADAIEDWEVKPFVLYSLRHTCLTR